MSSQHHKDLSGPGEKDDSDQEFVMLLMINENIISRAQHVSYSSICLYGKNVQHSTIEKALPV